MCEAAANWLGRRFKLPRPLILPLKFWSSTARVKGCSWLRSPRRAS
jgi:hypothetical protein